MIIAEVGINHQGDMELAERMIESAKQYGADMVKLQLYDSDRLARSPEAYKVLKEAELTYKNAIRLFDYGRTCGAEVFFSVFDVERVRWCEEMGVKRYKIAATMRDKATMDAVVATKKPIIVSLPKVVDLEVPPGDWLFCVPEYPTPIEHARIPPMSWFEGISDHTIGLDVAKIAIARGAQIIEKHFSLDHQTGADAAWSMTPAELRELKDWEIKCQTILT